MAGSSTTGRTSTRSASKRTTGARTATKRAPAKRAAPEREPSKRTSPMDGPLGGAFGGVLRDSVNSVMGSVGLNVPLRAIERLTGAVERAATLLERVERATRHLDELDAGFLDRLNDSFEVLASMRQDTRAMKSRVDAIESEMRELQALITERMDRVPLLRPSRRERKAAQAGGVEGE